MRKPITTLWLSAAVCLIAGCAKHVYIQVPESERIVLVEKGDKVMRQTIEPKEIELPWNGFILSEVEHERLRKIEEKLVLSIGELGVLGTTEAE